MIKLRIAFALIVLFSGWIARALPRISIENINGYEVHFVDIGRGDTFGATYQIQLGALSESGEYMGRAHLLEHVMHNGSRAYPGKQVYHELLRPIGVDANASTGYGRTFYHATATQRQAHTLLQVFLAPLGGLDWNRKSFERELDVVVNEVVTEGMPKDDKAFHQMILTQLLPKGHPWNHAPWGDLKSLRGLTMDSVKELYYANYRPENIKVTVQGNFSDPEFFAQVKKWTAESLSHARVSEDPQHYRQKQPPLNLMWAPSLFADPDAPTESERRLYIESSTMKQSLVLFETDLGDYNGRPEALDMLVGYLSLAAPGTFVDQLISERAWCTHAGFYTEKLGHKLQLHFNASLTDEGMKHVREINELMLSALRSVQLHGPPPSTVEILKDSIRLSLEQAAFSVPDFINTYAEFAADKRGMQEQVDSMMAVDASEIAAAARLFHPARALYVQMGPKLDEMEFDPMTKRHFIMQDNRADLKKYTEAVESNSPGNFAPVLTPLELKPVPSATVQLFQQSEPDATLPERATLDLRTDLPDTAVSATFRLAPKDPADLVIADLVMAAFNERYNGQLNFLNLRYGVSAGSGRMLNLLSFTASGENTSSLAALEWYLNELSNFVPSHEELERARQRFTNGANQNYFAAYSATIAMWEMVGHVDPLYLTFLERRDAARSFDLNQIADRWNELRRSSNKEFVMVGPFAAEDLSRLKTAARAISPDFLAPETVRKLSSRTSWTGLKQEIHQQVAGKNSNSFGVVRAYRGPPTLEVKKVAAFEVLNSLMHAKIRDFNRGDQGLGYIHGSEMKSLDGTHTHIIFKGQADSPANLDLTLVGWETVLHRLRDGTISDKEIRDSIDEILNSYDFEKTSARDALGSYSGGQSLHYDALSSAKKIAELKKMSVQDVRDIADLYLLKPDVASVQIISGDCENLLRKK